MRRTLHKALDAWLSMKSRNNGPHSRPDVNNRGDVESDGQRSVSGPLQRHDKDTFHDEIRVVCVICLPGKVCEHSGIKEEAKL